MKIKINNIKFKMYKKKEKKNLCTLLWSIIKSFFTFMVNSTS